jgi:hypothetical protein
MSIHQALAELKLLDKRITSATSGANYISHAVGHKPVSGFNSVKDYEDYATAAYQSVTSLISRRNRIKAAIVLSNALTKVKVGEVELTVAEAIERKTTIVYDQRLLAKMTQDYNNAVRAVDTENRNVQARLEDLLKISLGTDRKGKDTEAEAISKTFKEDNDARLIDPIGLRKKIDKLSEEIETFLTQIDYRLSESNTLTTVEIAD